MLQLGTVELNITILPLMFAPNWGRVSLPSQQSAKVTIAVMLGSVPS